MKNRSEQFFAGASLPKFGPVIPGGEGGKMISVTISSGSRTVLRSKEEISQRYFLGIPDAGEAYTGVRCQERGCRR